VAPSGSPDGDFPLPLIGMTTPIAFSEDCKMADAEKGSLVARVNDVLATKITIIVGSIWAFYAFVIFGLTPLVWPNYEQQILYWSNFLQLIFLPVITFGTAILSRDSQARAEQDHETIQMEFALLKEAHDLLGNSLTNIETGVRELLTRSDPNGAAATRPEG